MPATKVTGEVEFEGMVIDYDIDTFGTPQQWTLGEAFFVVAENMHYSGCGSQVCDFRRVYMNEPVYGNTAPNTYGFGESRSYRHGPVSLQKLYTSVTIDAEASLREFYERSKACDREYRNTIIKYALACEPLLRRDVRIKKGPNAGKTGYIFHVPPDTMGRTLDSRSHPLDGPMARADNPITPENGLYTILCLDDGETYQTTKGNIEVLVPTQNITGPVACLDCHNIYSSKEAAFMNWVTTPDISDPKGLGKNYLQGDLQSYNRPICGICTDFYQEREWLSFDRAAWVNLTGPYTYDENQPTTHIIRPDVQPLHSVLLEQRNSRAEQARRHPLRSRRR